MEISGLGRILIFTGIFLIVFGIFLFILPKIPLLNKMPGDIYFKKGNFSFYFPLATSIIISILLTLILNLFLRGR